jgi:hypothetical protein
MNAEGNGIHQTGADRPISYSPAPEIPWVAIDPEKKQFFLVQEVDLYPKTESTRKH